jgi:hypothetical protein
MERIPDLQDRMSRLEDAVSGRLDRIESLIREEMRDLQAGQLTDIKGAIDRVERDLKGEHIRLADDQRRLWDRVTDLERRTNEHRGESRGGSRVINMLVGFLASLVGAALALVAKH